MNAQAHSEQSSAHAGSYITFRVGNARFALEVEFVRYITAANSLKTRETPDDQKNTHTLFDFNNEAVALYRFSDIIGTHSQAKNIAELIGLLTQRKQDHINWIQALEHSLQTGEAFTKATDPHKCAFGLWYDNYTTDDEELAAIMSRFDAPHKRIHALAEELLAIAAKPQGINEALAILEAEKKSTLSELLKLFALATARLEDILKPVVIIIALGKSHYAIELDNIEDIQSFTEKDWLPDIQQQSAQLNCCDGFFQTNDNTLFLKINPHKTRDVIEYKWNEPSPIAMQA